MGRTGATQARPFGLGKTARTHQPGSVRAAMKAGMVARTASSPAVVYHFECWRGFPAPFTGCCSGPAGRLRLFDTTGDSFGAGSAQQGTALIEVGHVEFGDVDETGQIVEVNAAFLEGHNPALAQFAKDAVHMNGAQSERVGEVILR